MKGFVKAKKKWSANPLQPFLVSLVLHATGALLLLLAFQGEPHRLSSFTPIELVDPASKAPHTSRIQSKSKGDRYQSLPRTERKLEPVADQKTEKQDVAAEMQNSSTPLESPLVPGGQSKPGDGQAAATASALQMYVTLIVRKIDDVKIYPEDSIFRREEGRAVVSLDVLPDGTIAHYHLEVPCPFEALNHAALDTIASVGRLPPLPGDRISPLRIQIPLNYEISKR